MGQMQMSTTVAMCLCFASLQRYLFPNNVKGTRHWNMGKCKCELLLPCVHALPFHNVASFQTVLKPQYMHWNMMQGRSLSVIPEPLLSVPYVQNEKIDELHHAVLQGYFKTYVCH